MSAQVASSAPARAAGASAGGLRRLLSVASGAERYALPMEEVRGIQRGDRLRRNPSGDSPLGWLRGPGREVPVYSLAHHLGRGGNSEAGTVVVLPGVHEPWGLLVDRVLQVVELPEERLHVLPRVALGGNQRLFSRIAMQGDGLLLCLSTGALDPDGAEEPTPEETPPRRPGRTAAGTAGHARRLLLFSSVQREDGTAEVTFGLSLRQVLEILPRQPLIPVPNASTWTLGLLAWRGRPVPVVDLHAALGIPTTSYGRAPRLLVARTADGSGLLALPMSMGAGSVELPLEEPLRPVRLALRAGLTLGAFEGHGDTLVIPDLDAILRLRE